jgi:hypothetical protein
MIPLLIAYEYQYPLSTAIARGDLTEIQRLKQEGRIDINAFFDDYRRNLLLEALVAYAAEPNETRLHLLRWMLDAGANPAINCRYGYNALQVAARQGLTNALGLFLEFYPDSADATAFIQPEFPSKLLYPDVAKKIRTLLVPPEGRADTVQGEMMRIIDHLRDEAHRNGNANFRKEHKEMAVFVRDTLVRSGVFEKEVSAGIRFAAGRIMKARKPSREDEVYDYLVDRISVFYMKYEKGIPYVT